MSQKPHFFMEFLAVVSACALALASCSSSGSATKPDAAAPNDAKSPDAQVIIVYVTPDATPPAATTCVCVCADPCTCSCDCGTSEPIAVQMPDCIPPVITDAAPLVPDALTAPTVVDAAPVKDVGAPDIILAKDMGSPDIPLTASDTNTKPDTAVCTTPLCACTPNIAADASLNPISLVSIDHKTSYAPYSSDDLVTAQNGFGIYTSAAADKNMTRLISQVTSGLTPFQEIDIQYSFAGAPFTVGVCGCIITFNDWFSVRREFALPQSMCGYAGISFDVSADISSPRPEARLRLTLADVACEKNDADAGSDELWWFTFPQDGVGTDWKTVHIPFSAFNISAGIGTRQNDGVFDPRCIIAFEINYSYNYLVDCTNGCSGPDIVEGSGFINIRNLTTY